MTLLNRAPRSLLFFVCILAIELLPLTSTAQNSRVQGLVDKVNRLQRELTDLERHIYRGTNRPRSGYLSKSVKMNDKGSQSGARNSVRISQFENELRQITGRMEAIDFRLQKVQVRLTKLVSDIDRRLAVLEMHSQQLSTSRIPSQTGPTASTTSVIGNAGNKPITQPRSSGNPGVLGTIPSKLAVKRARGPIKLVPPPFQKRPLVKKPILPAGTPESQYDYIRSLLQRQDFQKAEVALKAFIAQYPGNLLTSNAYYWLAETYYVRRGYRNAALSFAEGFQKFPQGNKAPDSLLKLGMSLTQLKKRAEACTAFERLIKNFPKASVYLLARVKREKRKAKCR